MTKSKIIFVLEKIFNKSKSRPSKPSLWTLLQPNTRKNSSAIVFVIIKKVNFIEALPIHACNNTVTTFTGSSDKLFNEYDFLNWVYRCIDLLALVLIARQFTNLFIGKRLLARNWSLFKDLPNSSTVKLFKNFK